MLGFEKLFESDQPAPNLVFKGGASLSKVYGLIQRFSEDIDLVLNWELLGYGKSGDDPWQALSSNTKLNIFNIEFNHKDANYIRAELCPVASDLLQNCDGDTVDVSDTDGQIVNVRYPAAFSLDALRPEVKLEIGPLASWVPSGSHDITPYAAEEFPHVFEVSSCTVTVISAAEVFFETTLLEFTCYRTLGS